MFFRKKCVFSPNFLLPAKTPFRRGENRRKRRKTNGQNGDGGNGTGRKKGKDGRQGGGKNRRRKTERARGCRVNASGTGRASLKKGRAKNRANKIGAGRTSGGQVRGEKQNKCARQCKNRRRKEERRAGMRGCRVNAGGTGRAPLRKGRAKNRANRIGTGRTSGRQVRRKGRCARRRRIIPRNGQRAGMA